MMETNALKSLNQKQQDPKADRTQAQPPKPSAGHRRLDVFVGKWNGKGENKEGAPVLAGAPVTTKELYEWLSGKFFLIHYGEMHFVDQELNAIRIIGYDELNHQYSMDCFDSTGFYRRYLGTVNEDSWKFTGESERVEITIKDNGNTMIVHWEIKTDGLNWLPLCEFRAFKESD
ncbi:MAG: DUF1579 family protein [Chitinophagaceae bacterium]|nr:DUF1579 family protein [Chitinophagaceae bacterium]